MQFLYVLEVILVAALVHFTAAASLPGSAREEHGEARIVNGRDAAEGQFPWAAALFYNGEFICTSSVLGPRTILTAAHCVVLEGNSKAETADSFYAIANVNKAEPEVRIDFVDVMPHPGYSSDSLNDDLAILTTAVDIPFSDTVKPVCIAAPDTANDKYRNATAMGWGNTSPFRLFVNIPDTLQYVEQKIVPNSYCGWVNSGIDKNKICAKGLFNGICNGDSGGPLVHLSADKQPVEIGVASYINANAGCGKIIPAVFTRVSAYYDFIMKNSVDRGICST